MIGGGTLFAKLGFLAGTAVAVASSVETQAHNYRDQIQCNAVYFYGHLLAVDSEGENSEGSNWMLDKAVQRMHSAIAAGRAMGKSEPIVIEELGASRALYVKSMNDISPDYREKLWNDALDLCEGRLHG